MHSAANKIADDGLAGLEGSRTGTYRPFLLRFLAV
jgi:hypothetical protein